MDANKRTPPPAGTKAPGNRPPLQGAPRVRKPNWPYAERLERALAVKKIRGNFKDYVLIHATSDRTFIEAITYRTRRTLRLKPEEDLGKAQRAVLEETRKAGHFALLHRRDLFGYCGEQTVKDYWHRGVNLRGKL